MSANILFSGGKKGKQFSDSALNQGLRYVKSGAMPVPLTNIQEFRIYYIGKLNLEFSKKIFLLMVPHISKS